MVILVFFVVPRGEDVAFVMRSVTHPYEQRSIMPTPRRIRIFGPNGAGKSTLARILGERLCLPVVHLDALFWNPGWVPTEKNQFREKVAKAAAASMWVIDGNY